MPETDHTARRPRNLELQRTTGASMSDEEEKEGKTRKKMLGYIIRNSEIGKAEKTKGKGR